MSAIGHFVYFINLVKYSLSFSDAEDFTDEIQKLKLIKPNIDSEIVGNTYDDIIRLNFFKNHNVYERIVIDDNLEDIKEILINQINGYINYFTDFGECNNSIIVSGSLDYLSMVLEKETLDLEMEKDLLELFSNYVLDVKKIYDLCGDNPKVFAYMNLNALENKFNRIQNYISQELGIFPRLDDLKQSWKSKKE